MKAPVSTTPFTNGAIPLGAFSDESLFTILSRNRGWTDEFLRQINNPEHDELQNVDVMAAELHRIRTLGAQIVVLPDFDMDGITSGTLGWAGLNELGFDAQLYIPDFRRGHDISVETIRELRAQFPDAQAIITCDGGINSNDGIAEAKRLGFITLVTDHHLELAPGSVADIAVNPARIAETYAHPGICGAFVLYQVLIAYAERYAAEQLSDLHLLKLFAGVGTVSDVMPLQYENRKMVRDSISIARLLYVPIPAEDLATDYDVEQSTLMQLLRSKPHHPAFVAAFEGFALMMKAFKEYKQPILDENGDPVLDKNGEATYTKGKLASLSELNEEFYAFYMAPAFNAIRRIGGSMLNAFGVFCSPTAEQKYEHAKAIIDGNEQRKVLSAAYIEQLWSDDQPMAELGIYFTDAPAGMLGLIASSVMNDTGQPTVVVTRPAGEGVPVGGSARSPMWFPIISTMTPLGFTAVGHENACGVRAKDLAELIDFGREMKAAAESTYALLLVNGELAEASKADLVLGAEADCDAPLGDVDSMLELAGAINSLAPFGHEFARPQIELVVDLSRCSIQTLGSQDQHLRILLPMGMKVLWWNAAGKLQDLQDFARSPKPGESLVRLRVTVSINEFRGSVSPQAIVDRMIEKSPAAPLLGPDA